MHSSPSCRLRPSSTNTWRLDLANAKIKRIAILGATGSIGQSTIDVVLRHPDRFKVETLTANTNAHQLAVLCEVLSPSTVCMADGEAAAQLSRLLEKKGIRAEVLTGEEGLIACATHPSVDSVMAAIVGAAGLKSTLAACQAGKTVLLANKEALVMSGALLIEAIQQGGATLLPIDSEHNAIFQCLAPHTRADLRSKGVRRIILTASGGPFRTRARNSLARVTPDEACAHPKWVMGRKISVDSATMMNKGLEIIEAHWLFGAPREQIEVVIHPQSVVHSMVEYVDGSVIAQLGNPDMRTPIAHALAFPDRIESGVESLNLPAIGGLNFEKPDTNQFPAIRLAYEALQAGGTAPIVLNAANEMAVASFLSGQLPFLAITQVIEDVLHGSAAEPVSGIEHVLAVDSMARALTDIAIRRACERQ